MEMGDIIRRNARNNPGGVGLVFGADYRTMTWRELDERSNRLANGLRGLGLNRQERVAIFAPNCVEYLEMYLGVAKAGMVSVPLNDRLRGEDLTYPINHSEATGLIVGGPCREALEAVRPQLEAVKTIIGMGEGHGYPYDYERLLASHPPQDPHIPIDDREDLFAIAYTSGTTGKPKGAMITHYNALLAAMTAVIEMRILPHYTCLSCTPLFWTAGSTVLFPFLRGCTVIVIDFEPRRVLETIQRWKVTFTMLPPAFINLLLESPYLAQYDCSSLKTMYYAGSIMPAAQLKRGIEAFGPIFTCGYGLTETLMSGGTILHREDFVLEGPQARRLLSVGRAKINCDVRVVDENDRDVGRGSGEAGEIIVRGDTVIKGYWKNPEETAKAIKDGWFYTGDLATMDEEGYIYLVGRKVDAIVLGEQTIHARDVEEIIYTHPAVLDTAVIGVAAREGGAKVKAVVTVRDGRSATAEEILDLCRRNLPPHAVPAEVAFIPAMPKTPSGKILKRKLREDFAES